MHTKIVDLVQWDFSFSGESEKMQCKCLTVKLLIMVNYRI